MITKLDINLLALARQGGKDQTGLPGFYAVTPPRRTARGRSEDNLVVLLSCTGAAPFPSNLQEPWFERISQAYYQTPGSTTAAMRAAALALNQQLFDRTLRGAGTRQGLGLLSLIAVRGEQIYLAQCGPQHAFVIAPGRCEHFTDPETAGNGLGVARTIAIRFFQSMLHPNEYVLVTHQLPPGWDEATLHSAYGQGLESVRRRLLTTAGPEVSAILIHTQAGHGRLRLLKPKAVPPSAAAAPGVVLQPADTVQPGVQAQPVATAGPPPGATSPPAAEPAVPAADEVLVTPPPQTEALGPAELEPTESPPAGAEAAEAATPPAAQAFTAAGPTAAIDEQPTAASVPAEPAAGQPRAVPERGGGTRQTAAAGNAAPAASPRRLNDRAPSRPIQPRQSFFSILAASIRKAGRGTGKVAGRTGRAAAGGLRQLIKRLLPDEGIFHLPPSTMVFFAVAIPLIIAIVGGMMYLERGRTQEYQKHYDQAFDLAIQAGQWPGIDQQRAAWGLVLVELDAAESFRMTGDSTALRQEAQQALDQIEHVTRIDLQPAIRGDLDDSVQVSRIVATDEEIYLLNAARGNVMRALYTTRGFEIDTSFRCGKGTYGTIVVGSPLGIVALPKGNAENADILALDEHGNLVYCGPGSTLPMARRPSLPIGWNKPSAITLNPDNLNLYALDIPANQIWIFQKKKDGEDVWPFFAEEETRSLADVIDLTAASGDLFLLHESGQVSRCIYGVLEEIPARCSAVVFTGLPGGRADGGLIDATQLWQIVYAPPPGPSLYLLDASNQAILHFSLLGNFQNQYRAKSSLPAEPAVALAISPRRSVFMAVGNQVYYTNLP